MATTALARGVPRVPGDGCRHLAGADGVAARAAGGDAGFAGAGGHRMVARRAQRQDEPVRRIDGDGRVLTSSLMRWDNGQHGRHGYIPCGGTILEDRRFGDLTIPSRVSIGWWYGTPRYKPFFEATITAAEPST
jgi:hypothetical protein